MQHLLVTVLGTQHKEVTYSLEGKTARHRFAAGALLELLDEEARPNKLVAICTEDARHESLPQLEEAMKGLGIAVDVIPASVSATDEEVEQFLGQVFQRFPRDQEIQLTVDFTHGPRHLAVLVLFAALYLKALRNAEVRGVYYGFLQPDPAPLLNLQPLLDLSEWLHAVRTFKETGSMAPIVKLLPPDQRFEQLRRYLDEFSESYLSGLPLELELAAGPLVADHTSNFLRVFRDTFKLPLAEELRTNLLDSIKPYSGLGKEHGIKSEVALTREELERHALLVDSLLDRGHLSTGFRLMREWLDSWALYSLQKTDKWLEYRYRDRHGSTHLKTLMRIAENRSKNNKDTSNRSKHLSILESLLTPDQLSLGRFVANVMRVRNSLAHNGMRKQHLFKEKAFRDAVEQTLEYWRNTMRHLPEIPLTLGESTGRVFVSPVGKAHGSLYTTLLHVQERLGEMPDCCIAVSSKDTRAKGHEALDQAGFDGRREDLVLADAYRGDTARIDDLYADQLPLLAQAEEVYVNLTGGTTWMGIVVERIARQAEKLGKPVVKLAAIDTREPEAQKENPFVKGEVVWLSGESEDDETDAD